MTVTKTQVEKILKSQPKFTQLGFSMLVTRLTGLYEKNPGDAVIQQCTDEMNAFMSKYECIMAKDYDTITKL